MIEPPARDYAGFPVEVEARIRRGQYRAPRADAHSERELERGLVNNLRPA